MAPSESRRYGLNAAAIKKLFLLAIDHEEDPKHEKCDLCGQTRWLREVYLSSGHFLCEKCVSSTTV
jgi:late competence protein required for DNA uptake (superfamily II DNA/RNA helicase)